MFQSCTADSLFFTFPDCHNQHAGVSLFTNVSGNCQVTVIPQIPSICCSATVLPQNFYCLAHVRTRPVIDNSMLLANSTWSTLSDLHCFSKVQVNSLLCGNCCWSRLLGKSASGVYCQSATKTPSCASPFASVADLQTRCCPLPLAADDADFMSSLFLGFGSGFNRILSLSVNGTLMLLIKVLVLRLQLCCVPPSSAHLTVSPQPTPH